MTPRQIIGDRSRMSMRKNAQNENVKYIVKFNQKNTRPSTMSLFKGIDRSKIKQINRSQVLDHRVPVFLIVGSERSTTLLNGMLHIQRRIGIRYTKGLIMTI